MAPFVSFANDDQEYLNPRSETQLHSQRQMINQKIVKLHKCLKNIS